MAFFQAEKRPPCFLDKLPRGEKEQRMKSGKMDFGRNRSCFLSCERRGEGREGREGGEVCVRRSILEEGRRILQDIARQLGRTGRTSSSHTPSATGMFYSFSSLTGEIGEEEREWHRRSLSFQV